MLSAFARYYEGIGDKEELLDAILNYEFENYEETLEAISACLESQSPPESPHVLYSNGSSGDALGEYQFGPDFEFWCPSIEQFLRGYDVQVRISHGNKDTEHSSFVRPFVVRNNVKHYSVYLDLASQRNRAQLQFIIERICEEHKAQVSLCCKPNVWLLWGTDAEVREELSSCLGFVKSLINEDWEPWLHRSMANVCYFNDQMIDWKTGVNFYTCQNGLKHFLPIFYVKDGRSRNLLNLALGSVPLTDEWRLTGERSICECGRTYIPFDFRSHALHNLDVPREFINSLRSGYLNLQVLQNGSDTDVFYSCTTPFYDLDLLRSVLGGNAVFHEDERFYVGRKKYNFWKGDLNLERGPWHKPFPETIQFL